jgi:hypothetical protein
MGIGTVVISLLSVEQAGYCDAVFADGSCIDAG